MLDVNGAIKLGHSEIVMVSSKKFELKGIRFSTSNKLYGFAFGDPITTNNKNVLLYTHDGGSS